MFMRTECGKANANVPSANLIKLCFDFFFKPGKWY